MSWPIDTLRRAWARWGALGESKNQMGEEL